MSQTHRIILFIVCSIVLIAYAITGFFAHPAGDDFTYAILGQSDDFLQTVLHERARWNGRYISNFIVIFSPLNWGGIQGYQIMPSLLISLILFGTYGIYRNLIKTDAWLLALLSTTIIFSIMPDITEGIYWYTGAWTYLPGGVLFLLGVSLLVKHQDELSFKTLIIPILLFLLSAGFNEVIPLWGGALFAALILFKRTRTTGIIFTALFGILLTYVLLAPGNANRGSNFANNHDLFYSLYLGAAYTGRFIGEWLLNPALYVWSIVLLSININKQNLDKIALLKKPLVILFVLFIPTYLACFAPIWSTGMLGQYRTANLSSYLFVISLSLVLIANKELLLTKIKINLRSPILLGTLLVSLLVWKNQFSLFIDYASGEVTAFDDEMENRYQILQTSKSSSVEVPRIENITETLFVYPLHEDPHHWINEAYAKYYGLEEVRLTPPRY